MRGAASLVAASTIVAAVCVATAWAGTFRGTAKADVIHGTAKADVIYGLGGNDKLYGGAGNDRLYGGSGNDLLVGGPGADVLNCGPGRDTAIAGKGDTVIGCETVKGLPRPTTTTSSLPQWQNGRYCGFTNNGGSICFDVAGNPVSVANAQYSVTFDSRDCSPGAAGTVNYSTSGGVPLHADGSFDFSIATGDNAGSDINGVVDTAGAATGNLHVHSVLQSGGTTYTCTLDATWSAKKQ